MKFKLVALFGVALVLGVLAFSNGGAISAQEKSDAYKIGIVNLQKVVNGYGKQQEQLKKLQDETNVVQEELNKKKTKFEEEVEKFKTDRDNLSEDAQADREAALQSQMLEIEGAFRQAEADLDRKKRRLKETILKDIVAAVDAIGDKENFHLILEADPEARTGVLYFATPLDITGKVSEYLNRN
jgi:Skp family chaperone for outer membrane proteins